MPLHNRNKVVLTDKIGGKGFKALISNTKLKELYTADMVISEQDANVIAEALKENPDLQVLILYRSRIGDKGAGALAKGLKAYTALETYSFMKIVMMINAL